MATAAFKGDGNGKGKFSFYLRVMQLCDPNEATIAFRVAWLDRLAAETMALLLLGLLLRDGKMGLIFAR